jgi:hypothetical protein
MKSFQDLNFRTAQSHSRIVNGFNFGVQNFRAVFKRINRTGSRPQARGNRKLRAKATTKANQTLCNHKGHKGAQRKKTNTKTKTSTQRTRRENREDRGKSKATANQNLIPEDTDEEQRAQRQTQRSSSFRACEVGCRAAKVLNRQTS